MDRTERFHIIDQMLCNQTSVTLDQFLQALEISLATFKRDLEYMRDRLAAPIIWSRELNAYCYDQNEVESSQYQLPGLWFSTGEIQALLTMDALLESLQPGMLTSHIKPLRSRIRMLLDKGDHSADEIAKRIRILPALAKSISAQHFQTMSQALLNRKRLMMTYHNRQDDSETSREISPQRLTHYRDSWYLDACADNWGAFITPDYNYVMPVAYRRKLGIKYLYQPRFCQQLGIYSSGEVDGETTQLFLKAMKRSFGNGDYAFNEGNLLNPEPGISVSDNKNFTLSLAGDVKSLREGYSSNCR